MIAADALPFAAIFLSVSSLSPVLFAVTVL